MKHVIVAKAFGAWQYVNSDGEIQAELGDNCFYYSRDHAQSTLNKRNTKYGHDEIAYIAKYGNGLYVDPEDVLSKIREGGLRK